MKKEDFNVLVRKEIPKWEAKYKEDLIKLGHGYDWDATYSTISSESIALAQRSFIDLYKKGLAYRKEEPTIWCTRCQTALAQADLEEKERETKLNYINFSVEGAGQIEIATTRPELLPACVGIFVHPTDERYKKFIGKTAVVPIFGQKIKIMADEKADPNFGTGAVMTCTFGDKTDIDWWKKHKLPLRIVLEKNGRLNELAGQYKGMKLEEARKEIITELQKMGILNKQETLKQTIRICWRCPTAVEFIVTKQWFINILDNKEKFIELGKKIHWHPEYYLKLYENWVENLSWDWLISRQRHFGPNIPVWYCEKCQKEILPDEKDLPVSPETDRPKKKCACGSDKFVPETDVFDTWMTSSLTPQLVLGWDNKKYGAIFPMTVRASARDIIRTWEFYTIVKSWYHFKSLPWTNTLISGMIYDAKGEEMHKSRGNAVAPQDVIVKYCADAFRYWTISSTIGESLVYNEKELVRAQKLLIKLWNVARFCEPNLLVSKSKPQNIIDKWILSRLSDVINSYTKSFDNYDPATAQRVLDQFFWQEFCDFYLEMIKYRIYGADEKDKKSAQTALYECIQTLLKLWAPVLPHITEEIYQDLFAKSDGAKSIHISDFPKPATIDKNALELGNLAVEAITAIRKHKADKNMSLGAELDSVVLQHPQASKLESVAGEIKGTMRIKQLELRTGELTVR